MSSLEKPATLADDIAYAKGTLAGWVNSSAAALDKGQIKAADAERVQSLALQARGGLALASNIYESCIKAVPTKTVVDGKEQSLAADVIRAATAACGTGDALANYRMAQSITTQLRTYLQTKGVK